MTKILYAAVAAAMAVAATPAAAATPIDITYTGNFTGVNGGPFDDLVSLTGTTTAEDVLDNGNFTFANLVGNFSTVAGPFTVNFTNASATFNGSGFNLFADGGLLAVFNFASPISGTGLNATFNAMIGQGVAVNVPEFAQYGSVQINGGAGVVRVSAAVPEPATWALMLIGFGGMGLAMRRKRGAQQQHLPQLA